MKRIIFLFSLITGSAAIGQQLTYNSQYMLNQYLINPAAVGTTDYLPVSAIFRQQWAGFKDAPKTQVITANGKLGESVGVGGMIYNDVTGPLRNIGLQASYAYQFKISPESKLSLGVSAILSQHVLDGSSFVLHDQSDLVLNGASQKSFNPDASFGAYYYAKSYFIGFSSSQLLQNKYKFGDQIQEMNRQVRHYFVSGGYTFDLSSDFKLEPSFLLKAVAGVPVQFDINSRLHYKENLWTGLSYRNKESIVMMLGIQREQFVVAYSYDYTTSKIKNYSVGTHEIFLQFQLSNNKSIANPSL